jgi:hypothetical protein
MCSSTSEKSLVRQEGWMEAVEGKEHQESRDLLRYGCPARPFCLGKELAGPQGGERAADRLSPVLGQSRCL